MSRSTDIRIPRRDALRGGFAALWCGPSLLSPRYQDEPYVTRTFTYKRVGDLKIRADVHRANDSKLRPVVVWIHGGALINGHRGAVSGRVRRRMLEAGYVLVSIDYRLAPETRLPEIISDVEDAFGWLRRDGGRLFQADTRRIAVIGGSAGGCLTLVSGYRVRPRPTVLVSLWGYGDLIGDWYSKPSPHRRHNKFEISREAAYAQVKGPPVADARDRRGNGSVFYLYCRQRGIWPQEVSGWNPKTEADKFYPYMAVRNVTPQYPPTLLIHGADDTDVPFEQSRMMADQFRKHGTEHNLIRVPGGEHGLAGADKQLVDRAHSQAWEFIDRHMRHTPEAR